jgi:hypothetical protein
VLGIVRTELRILIVEDVAAEAEIAAYHLKAADIQCTLRRVEHEDRAIQALKRGAIDYVLESNPARIKPAVRRALEEVE